MVAGPLASSLLADLGAEVIKIETPKGGDRMRFLGHRVGGIGAFWANVNRGKRSVVIDLQRPEGVAILRDIVARADVFIQNFRPGVVERLGVDEPALLGVRPLVCPGMPDSSHCAQLRPAPSVAQHQCAGQGKPGNVTHNHSFTLVVLISV